MKLDSPSLKKYFGDNFLVLFFVAISVALATSFHISHSEFWAISVARYWGQWNLQELFIYAKPLFYGVLKLPYAFNLDNVSHVIFARGLFGLLGAINLFLIFKFTQALTPSARVRLTLLALLLTNHTFFSQFFRVRSDVFALTFILLALIKLQQKFKQNHTLKIWDWPLMGLAVLSFLATPKAIFALILLVGTYLILFRKSLPSGRLLLFAILQFFMPVALWVSVVALASSLFLFDPTHSPLLTALNYWLSSLQLSLSSNAWTAVLQTLKINLFHYSVMCAGLILIFYKKNLRSNPQAQMAGFLSLASLVIVLFYPERWDFFIACYLPFLLLPGIFVLNAIFKKRGFLLGLAIAFLSPFYLTYFQSWVTSNQNQRQALKEIERILSQAPQSTYFDSAGLLPRHEMISAYLDKRNPSSWGVALARLKRERPEFLLQTGKVDLNRPEFLEFFLSQYQETGPGFWVRKDLNSKDLVYEGPDLETTFNYAYRPQVRWFY